MSDRRDSKQQPTLDEPEQADLDLPEQIAEKIKGGARPDWSGPGDESREKARYTSHHKP
jgi:hypothetical protein